MQRPRWLTEDELQVWHGFLRLQTELGARLNRQLQSASDLSLPEYEVLAHLSYADGRLRILALADILQWEKSRLSHQLTRMERKGLVARESCETDRRGAFVVLTDEGRRLLTEAAPGHVEEVRSVLFDALTPAQVQSLGEIARAVLDRLEPEGEARARR